MADESLSEEKPAKSKKLPILIGLILAMLGAAGGFVGVSKIPMFDVFAEPKTDTAPRLAPLDTTFIPLDPMVISIGSQSSGRHLKFTAHLEVEKVFAGEVEYLKPRIMDTFNTYLQAVEISDLSKPSTMSRIKGQLLRRMQIVVGEGRVKNILIVEFVIT